MSQQISNMFVSQYKKKTSLLSQQGVKAKATQSIKSKIKKNKRKK
jgi:hypothetical protein